MQSIFEDFLILDMYNKLSRLIASWMFYLSLAVFLIGMNVNDTFLHIDDPFFISIPPLLLLLALVIAKKYSTQSTLFYPPILLKAHQLYSNFLISRKAFNFIRFTHFYAIVFAVWIYRVYSELILPTH